MQKNKSTRKYKFIYMWEPILKEVRENQVGIWNEWSIETEQSI